MFPTPPDTPGMFLWAVGGRLCSAPQELRSDLQVFHLKDEFRNTRREIFRCHQVESFGLLFYPTFPLWKICRVCERYGTMDGTSLPVATALTQDQVLFVGVFAG